MANRYPATGEMVTLRDAMDRLVADAFGGTRFRTSWPADGDIGRMGLPLDAYSTDNEFVLIAAIPGVDPDALDVTINKNTVTLAGETPDVTSSEETQNAQWYLHELPHGSFSRSISLPADVDATRADATFEHGILKLVLPKAEAAKPRRIQVRVGAQEAISSEAISEEE